MVLRFDIIIHAAQDFEIYLYMRNIATQSKSSAYAMHVRIEATLAETNEVFNNLYFIRKNFWKKTLNICQQLV